MPGNLEDMPTGTAPNLAPPRRPGRRRSRPCPRRPNVQGASGAYQARYCSDRCRNRALKRAFRERHRDREVAADVERTSA